MPSPSYLVGHSMGELTAPCHAGSVDFPTAPQLVLTQAQLISDCFTPGGMLATTGMSLAELTAVMAAEGSRTSTLPTSTLRIRRLWPNRPRPCARWPPSFATAASARQC